MILQDFLSLSVLESMVFYLFKQTNKKKIAQRSQNWQHFTSSPTHALVLAASPQQKAEDHYHSEMYALYSFFLV